MESKANIKETRELQLVSLLKFAAPSVLTAMWALIIFVSDNQLTRLDNIYFISGMITLLTAI